MAIALGLSMKIGPLSGLLASVITTGMQMWHKFTASTWSGSNRLPDSSPVATNTGTLFTGNGLSFDGVNDVVTVGNTGASVKTVVFYVNPGTTTQSFMQLQSTGAVRIQIASGTLSATGFTSPTLYVNGVAGSTVTASAWQMIAITSATAVTASNVLFGQQNTTFFSGSMTNVKFFSTELNSTQIAELYANPEQGLPTGSVSADLAHHWPMCEGHNSLSAIYDVQANKKHGVNSGATYSAALTSSTLQTGLVSQTKKIYFGGSNTVAAPGVLPLFDFVSSFTISCWAATSSGSYQGLVSKYATTPAGFDLGVGGTIVYMGLRGTSSISATAITYPNDGRLHHIMAVCTTANVKIYIDGALSSTTAGTWTPTTATASPLQFGARNSTSYLSGWLDGVCIWNTALADADATSLAAGTDPLTISAANVQGYWVNSVAATWEDLSTNNNHATVSGTVASFTNVANASGKDLVGVTVAQPATAGRLVLCGDGYASVSDAATLDITTAITIEAWVKPFSVSAAQTIAGKNTSYALNITSGAKLQFQKWTSTSSGTLASSASISTTAWTHVAATYSTGACKLYINGAQDTTSAALTGSIDATSTALLLGALTTSSQLFNGQIDSVKVYNTVLTAADIAKNYAAERSQFS